MSQTVWRGEGWFRRGQVEGDCKRKQRRHWKWSELMLFSLRILCRVFCLRTKDLPILIDTVILPPLFLQICSPIPNPFQIYSSSATTTTILTNLHCPSFSLLILFLLYPSLFLFSWNIKWNVSFFTSFCSSLDPHVPRTKL